MNSKINELLSKIIVKVNEINLKEKSTIIFYYLGHTKGIELDVYTSGWKEYNKPEISINTYLDLDGEKGLEDILKVLEELEEIGG